MKNSIRKIVYSIFSIINLFIPKFPKILIYAIPRLDDNSEALFRYIIHNTNAKVVCITNEHLKYDKVGNYTFIKQNFIIVLFHMLTCSVLLDSCLHSVKMKPTKKQMFLQLWHGSPLKYLSPSKSICQGDYFSKISYNAEVFRETLQVNEFNVPDSKMFLNGYPRNDYLFKTVKKNNSINREKEILWLPTYRHWGNVIHSNKDIPILHKDNVDALNNFLKEKNVKIYIKPHPLQSVSFEKILDSKFSNIILIYDYDLTKQNVSLYEFLANMDALLTDYSSVMFDFLLVDRPIGFTIDDFDEFSKHVGFNFDNPKDLMAGKLLYSIDDLKSFIQDLVDGTDSYSAHRNKVNQLVNHFKDGNSSQRAFELIKPYIA